jgi:hypothetical protein
MESSGSILLSNVEDKREKKNADSFAYLAQHIVRVEQLEMDALSSEQWGPNYRLPA